MCLECMFGYFSLNATFWAESKALFCFVLMCWYEAVQFGAWSSCDLWSAGKIFCISIYNSHFFFVTLLAPEDISLLCVEGWEPAQSFCGCGN